MCLLKQSSCVTIASSSNSSQQITHSFVAFESLLRPENLCWCSSICFMMSPACLWRCSFYRALLKISWKAPEKVKPEKRISPQMQQHKQATTLKKISHTVHMKISHMSMKSQSPNIASSSLRHTFVSSSLIATVIQIRRAVATNSAKKQSMPNFAI